MRKCKWMRAYSESVVCMYQKGNKKALDELAECIS